MRDVKDAEWLCQLLEAGLLRASFVPPMRLKPIMQHQQPTNRRPEPDPVSQGAEWTLGPDPRLPGP